MATEDISRYLFQPRKRYSGVRMQQGRVLLDSDWNEDERIDSEEIRRTLIDIVCAKGSSNQGFLVLESTLDDSAEVTLPDQNETKVETYNFDFANGSFYLGGLRFETETDAGMTESLLLQQDWLQIDASASNLPQRPSLTGTEISYDLVYLRGWEQCVTAVEDRELRERALGGPDTSVRIRRMRRVEVLQLTNEPKTCAEAFSKLQQMLSAPIAPDQGTSHPFDEFSCQLRSKALLTVAPDPDGVTDDPCKPAVASGYLGADNQAIRVQLTATDRFIWGYDNAAPLYRVQVKDIPNVTNGERRKLKFLTLPRDQMAHPLAGQAVELIPWGAILPNREKVAEFQGKLFTVSTSYDPEDNSITIAQPVDLEWLNWLSRHNEYWSNPEAADEAEQEKQQYLYLRLWTGGSGDDQFPDHQFTPDTITPDAHVSLTGTGLQVKFSDYGLSGDFWVIAARPNTPDIVVPWELLDKAPPVGPRYFFAPLALIRWSLDENGELKTDLQDCRERFQPLCQVQGCCTVTVGDGSNSQGLFNSLEDAIDFLPAEGGKICLLPGRHQANVSIENRQNIQITGCGCQTIVQPRPGQEDQPIFQIASCQNIQLEQMTLVAQATTAIQVLDPPDTQRPSQGIHILENKIIACIHAIEIQVNNARSGNNDIWIAHNQIGLLDKEVGKATIFCLADDVLIERNRLVVLPPPDANNPNDPRNPDDFADDPFDPCFEPERFSDFQFPLELWVVQTLQYITQLAFIPPRIYQALGGIQIGGGSEQVTITHNEITGGAGNGITFGHLPLLLDANADPIVISESPLITAVLSEEVLAILRQGFDSTLYDLTVEQNTIQSMGLSGIGTVMFPDVQDVRLMVRVETLTIHRNLITNCLQQPPEPISTQLERNLGLGGISLAACEAVKISENRIENNGLNYLTPTCGIFILLGEQVTIQENHILNNGPFEPDLDRSAQRGLRGGIVMACLSSRVALPETDDDRALPLNLGVGDVVAAKVHGNTVSQPLSQALIILAIGPLSITDNVFASQDVDLQANPFAAFSGAVLIVNLGLPIQEVLGGIGNLLLSSRNQSYQSSALDGNIQGGTNAIIAEPAFDLTRLLFWPSGNILFNDNQTVFDLREVNGRTLAIDGAFSSQFIFSLDDVSFNGNQSDCNFLLDLLITNVFVFGFSVRVSNNRLKEGFLAFLSIFSLSVMNITAYNQCSHCIYAKGASGFETEDGNQILYPGPPIVLTDIPGTILEFNSICTLIKFIFDGVFGASE